jgi:hypothetical protein
MPIATCFLKEGAITEEIIQQIAQGWATDIGVATHDVCLTVVSNYVQAGRTYAAMVHLLLPTLWQPHEVRKIQKSLAKHIASHLQVKFADIFIISSMVESGNVLENGNVVEW